METFNRRPRFLTWIVGGCVIIASTFGAATGANAQELITNGNFSNGLTGWSQESWAGGSVFGINANGPTDTSAASGNYAYAGGGTYNLLTQNVTVTTGSAYRLSFLAGSKSGQGSAYGILSLYQGLPGNTYNAASFDYFPSDAVFGSYTVDFVADTTTIGVWLRSDAGTYEAYDNVSVTPIVGVANAMNFSSASGYSEIRSALTGSGKVTSNAGTGGLTLSAANTYTGGTEVTGGTLFVTGAGTLGAASGSVTVSGGGQLDLRNQQIRTGTIAMVGQDARILSGDVNNPGSLVNNGVALQFGGGLLGAPLSGSAGMNVTGGGSITGSNSYAGPTTISATPGWYGTNTLYLNNANALGAASGNLAISGGVVSLQNNTITRTGSVTISGGSVQNGTLSKSSGVYDIQGGQVGVVLAGSAGVTKSGTGSASLTNSNSFSGGTQVTGGTLLVTGTGTLGAASGNVTVTASTGGVVVLDLRNQQIRTGTITMVGDDARIISGDVNNPGSIVNNGVAFQFGGGQLSVPLSGSAGMNVTGGGSITGSNSYAGPTTITTTPGWYGTNTFFVDNANALGAASADLTILGGLVSLQNNTVTRTGNVTISGGQVLSGTFSKPSGAYDVQGGQIGVVLAGAAGVTKSGTGTAILTGANTYTGTTTVSLGTLLIGSGGTSGSIAGNIVNNASLIFNRSDALTYAGLISGTGSVTKQGAGTLTLTGSSTYSGPTAISSGALAVNGSIASAVNVANAATLGGAGTINGLVTVAGGGILAPGNSPGTLTMTAGLSLADASILNFELVATDTTAGGGINDLIVVNGNFLLDGVLNVAGTGDFSTVANYTKWRLFNYSGGTFTDGVLTLGTMPSVGASGKFFQIDTTTAGQVNLVIVPEPGALALAGFGIAAAWALRRRLKKPGAEATG